MARLLVLLLAFAFVVVAVLVARESYLFDRWLAFFPEREITNTPDDLGMPFEDVYFPAADGKQLHGWFIPGRGDDTVVWFHGNAGNISNRVYNIMLMNVHLGANLFIFDYRGYGLSEGRPSEKGMYSDGEGVLEYLRSRKDIDQDRLVLFGRSLGGCIVAELAMSHRTKAVIMESSFTSVDAMSHYKRPAIASFIPSRLLVKSRFESLAKMPRIHSPVMIVHGSKDVTVPIEMGRELYEAANEPKRFYEIKGATHDDTHMVGGENYFRALREFIEEASSDYTGR
ncbi:MAG: alpha/beta hydrolase [Chloroflexi bacterium]|nr:alpha/beta hydrolase [Chloroflexota bacterium]